MTKEIIIVTLLLLVIYLYYQNRKKPHLLSGNPTDPDYQQKVSETIASLKEEAEDLETERDKAIRDKRETEQQLLAINNRLNNKVQETKRKEEEIDRLKKEKSEQDKTLRNNIAELKRENKKLKEDYQKKVKQLDTEQTEANKLESENEKLQEQITELKSKISMPGSWNETKWIEKEVELEKNHQEQLRKINLLFDEKTDNYETIDFNGLYGLLKTVAERMREVLER